MNSPLDYIVFENTGLSTFPREEAEEIFEEIAFTVYNEALEKFLENATEEEGMKFEEITEDAKDENELFTRLSHELPQYVELVKTTSIAYKDAVLAYKNGENGDIEI